MSTFYSNNYQTRRFFQIIYLYSKTEVKRGCNISCLFAEQENNRFDALRMLTEQINGPQHVWLYIL